MEFITQFVLAHPNEIALALLVTSFFTLLCLVATMVAKLTKTKVDDDIMKKVDTTYFKVLSFLPTFGINPTTKMLQEALKEALKALDNDDDDPKGSA